VNLLLMEGLGSGNANLKEQTGARLVVSLVRSLCEVQRVSRRNRVLPWGTAVIAL
jgi:hypothetical protein